MTDNSDILRSHIDVYADDGIPAASEDVKVQTADQVDLGDVPQIQCDLSVPDTDVREIILSQDGGQQEASYLSSPMQQVELNSSQDGRDCPECAICCDKGSGYHYSVYSCEGCKGFFKRSVQKNLLYNCKEQQNCSVNKFTRNNCQFCRFKKCLEAGMKRDAVREDRTPGGKQKSKRIKVDEEGSAIADVINTTTAETYDEEGIQKLVEAHPDVIPSAEDILSSGESDSLNIDINTLMQYGYMELRLIIEWARKIPGFSDLMIEDQMALLKGSFMELNVLRLAFRSVDCDDGVRFAEGLVLTPEDSGNIGWGKDLVSCTMEFITKVREINLDHTEFCILNAVVLTYPDANGIKDKDTIITLQSRILNCLRQYTCHAYSSEPRRYGKILLRLPSLRTVSAIAAERFLSMSLDGNIKMNALVLEMMS